MVPLELEGDKLSLFNSNGMLWSILTAFPAKLFYLNFHPRQL